MSPEEDRERFRKWHAEARQEAADLRAENARLAAVADDAQHRLEALWDCLEKRVELETERDRLAAVVERITRAWAVEGPRPDYHRQQQARIMRDWPTLADAIRAAVEEANR